MAEPPRSMIQDLPEAMQIVVLRHLGGPRRCEGYLWPYALLCRVCAAAADAPELWRHLDLSAGLASQLSSRTMFNLLRRHGRGKVERLCLNRLEEVDDAFVRGLGELFADGPLKAVDVGGCTNVSGKVLPALGEVSTLEELGASCVGSLEDEHLAAVCRRCPRLARLDVRFCEALASVGVLLARPPGSAAWAALQLDGCFRLDETQLLRVAQSGAWTGLVELSLDGEELDAQQLALISATFPRLCRFSVSFAREMDASALHELAKLQHLDALTLRKASQPTDDDWAVFFSRQYGAHLGACGDAGSDEASSASILSAREGHWRVLKVAECEHFSDAAATALAAKTLPALSEIDLSWCWHLSDAGLSTLLAASPGLQHVKLAGMKNLTSASLAPCCRMPRLLELDCTSCNGVADMMLEFLLRLFAAPPQASGGGEALPRGSVVEALPQGVLTPCVARAAEGLWRRRYRAADRLQIKNYYAEYLQDWAPLRPAGEVCEFAEAVLAAADGFGG